MASGSPGQPTAIDSNDTAETALQHPSAAVLGMILAPGSTRADSLEAWVQRLDARNLQVVPHPELELLSDREESIQLIEAATQDLPRLTPLRERTLLFLVRVQPELLLRAAVRGVSTLQAVVEQHRTRRRVLDPQRHRIFGDIRDTYIANFYFALEDLDRAYRELGASGDPYLRFPSHLRTVEDLELFFRQRIEAMLARIPGPAR